jgi:regulator of nucleoside diphosphate kinase
MGRKNMTLTDVDRGRLGSLLTCAESAAYGSPRSRFRLEAQIEEAESIPAACAPRTLVTMNSTVMLTDVSSGQRRTCTLVYPDDTDLIPGSVGVLQPLGQSILGCSVGDTVRMTDGGGTRKLKIESIVYQPEFAGAAHL